jgi:hypothetical protein
MKMIEIKNYSDGLEPVVGTFDVYLPKIRLLMRRFSIKRSKKGGLYISFPAFMVSEDAMGKKTFVKYMEFDSELQKEFETKLRKELEVYCPALGSQR